MSKIFLSMLILLSLAWSQAQSFKLGIILSQTGTASQTGQMQARALDVLESQLRQNTFGRNIEILIRDDGSNPQTALREARALVEEDNVLALICCTLEPASNAVSSYSATQQILTLSLSSVTTNDWTFSVKPDTRKLLQSIILLLSRKGQQSIAVMTLDNTFGDQVQSALDLLLTPGGMQLAVMQRYRPDVTVLTPEALWVATRQPSSVLVWGLLRDSQLAYQSLRKRGYEQNVILNPELLESSPPSVFEGATFPVAATETVNTLSDTQPNYLETFRFSSEMAGIYGPGMISTEGAYAYDALNLVKSALEQALTFGVPTDDTTNLRYALRDALVGMPSYQGAAAVYDYSDSDHIGVDPYSLVLAKVINGVLVSLP